LVHVGVMVAARRTGLGYIVGGFVAIKQGLILLGVVGAVSNWIKQLCSRVGGRIS